jgi:hypothetical protein
MKLLDYLSALAAAGTPCPSNGDIAAAIRRSRSYVARTLSILETEGAISRRGLSTHRVVTVLRGPSAGLRTGKAPPRPKAARRPPPGPPPACVVCGGPVECRSGKYARSCDRPTCRHNVRRFAYGGDFAADDTPWPVVTGPVAADFAPHNLAFRANIRRGAGTPMTSSYGVSTAYERGAPE